MKKDKGAVEYTMSIMLLIVSVLIISDTLGAYEKLREEMTEVINHSTYEEVGWFLLGLSDDEFEKILERDTTLIYPIYTFQDTGDGGIQIPILT